MIVKKCPQCNEIFYARKNSQLNCSRKCSNNAKIRPRRNLICKTCKKEFTSRLPESNKTSLQLYCSLECQRGKVRLNKEQICPVCSKKFYAVKKFTKYCSIKCQHETQKQKSYEADCIQCSNHFVSNYKVTYIEAHPNLAPRFCSKRCMYDSRSKPKVIVNCTFCGKEVLYHESELKHSKLQFCSKKCTGKHYSGVNSHAWKGGITSEVQKIRHSPEYKAWQLSVFYRDGKACVFCGSKKNIEADHIKPFSLFPELRFDLDNGRTLCHDCHVNTPSYKNRWMKKEDFL